VNLDLFIEALPPTMQLDYGARAEAAGFRAAWFPEITFGDAFGPATGVALRTSRLDVGTGVVGIWSRSAVTMALQAATLNELSSGRLILGVGLQARGYVEGWHGQTYERPVLAMREYMTILRRIFTGEAVTFEGEVFSVRNFQLMMQPPERPVRIYLAAIGPQMLRLAGELADGVLGYCWSLEYVRDVVLPNLHAGAERGGRDLAAFDVACGFPALVADDGLDAIRGQALMFATAGGSSPEYAKSIGAAGFGAEVEEIAARFEAGDVPGALGVVTEEMADAVTIAGPADHVHERLDAYREAGLGTIGLNPAAPGVFFPLYEGHFPEGAAFPTFSFPAYLDAIDDVLAIAAA
jgi:alkanesulfonate monooxygenase SsuD/methylene tetrahydromethanopterin reductase-like flavin-dependent oxidoreductase (luciferase family)